MYHVSAQGVDERMINVHYYYYKTLFERREHTDSFRGYNLFTSSMQQRHPRPMCVM